MAKKKTPTMRPLPGLRSNRHIMEGYDKGWYRVYVTSYTDSWQFYGPWAETPDAAARAWNKLVTKVSRRVEK